MTCFGFFRFHCDIDLGLHLWCQEMASMFLPKIHPNPSNTRSQEASIFLIDLLMDLIIHFGSNLGPNLGPCWQPTWAQVGSQVGAKVNKRIHQQIYQFRSKRDSTNPRQFPRRVWARFLRFPKRARARCWRVWG